MPSQEALTGRLTLAALNRMERARFTRALGAVFESSPWVAERAWAARPFASVDTLHRAMADVVRRAPRETQVALLRAHPDLAGKAAREGAMTASSVAEQSSAGLDRLSDEESERFGRLNAAYRQTFGFPFIIAVRRHDKAGILAAFERRLGHTAEEEVEAALAEVFDITRMRLDALLSPA
ncbi:MAG TPA: 2-oxo-4-hydroxy-4-carboxy-5-ureidoimidazoline decarboxylase [Methylomirabilota bacterium]|nr:2-oxo-4-hydroxy-4-carboxy-5-ureidoimidazoline decarboxylase [Methylomirabilota bacterium]